MLVAAELAPEKVRPLRRVEFDRLVALGEFEDERVELLQGVLVEMTPPGPSHASVVDRLTAVLVVAVRDRGIVRVQNPLALSDDSEPEPDVAIVPPGDYSEEHPSRALLVTEVAEASLNKDRNVKRRLYARAGVPEYWIVNLVDNVVEVHTDPLDDDYARTRRFQHGERIQVECFGDIEVQVTGILPSRPA